MEELTNSQLRSLRLKAAKSKGTHTKYEWNNLVERCKNQCVRCGELSRILTKDHIIPIYQGGSDAISNLQPLCRGCNSAKGPENIDWLAERGLR